MVYGTAFIAQAVIVLSVFIIASQDDNTRAGLGLLGGCLTWFLILTFMWFIGLVLLSTMLDRMDTSAPTSTSLLLVWSIAVNAVYSLWLDHARYRELLESFSSHIGYVAAPILLLDSMYVLAMLSIPLLIGIESLVSRSGRNESANPDSSDFAREEEPTGAISNARSDSSDSSTHSMPWVWRITTFWFDKITDVSCGFLFIKRRWSEDQVRRALAISFALTNLWVASIYDGLLYDSTGTVKPSWTEMLG